jgi:hypothetical protein
MTSDGGKADQVFSVVERIEDGHLAYVEDKWFIISESSIEPTTLDKWFNDSNKLKQMLRLQQAINLGDFENGILNFKIDENLHIGVNVENGELLLNGEKTNKETTLENVFNSPIVPFTKKDFYPIISETINNIDKFVDLDIALKIYNVTNPFLESIVFNYKDKIYTYNVDRRYGNSFYEYQSAVELVNEMQSELGYDLTYFFKNKFDNEILVKKDLENKEKVIMEALKEVEYNIDRLNVSGMLELDEIATAKTELVNEKKKLENQLQSIKKLMNKSDKEKIVKY